MAVTYEPIATTTSSSAGQITFSSIPATYTDLVLVITGSSSGSAILYMEFNGDTASNYSTTFMYAPVGGSPLGQQYTIPWLDVTNAGANPATHFVNIFNYSDTNMFKSWISRFACGRISNELSVGTWRNTAAINSITIKPSSNNLGNKIFTLFGIKEA